MFHGGGGSVPAPVPHTSHRCPGGLAPRAFPHRTPRLFQSEARVAEVSGQPVPPGSLLTLGAPRDADGHTDGWTDGQTDTRQSRDARSRRSTLPGTQHRPRDQRAVTPPSDTSAPGAGGWHGAALPAIPRDGTGGTNAGQPHRRSSATFHSRSLQRRRQPPPSSAPADPRPAPRTERPARSSSPGAVPQPQQLLPRAALAAPPGRDPRAPPAAPAGSPARAGSAAAGSSAEPAPRASPGGRGGAGRCRGRIARSARRGALPQAGGAKMEARQPPAHPGLTRRRGSAPAELPPPSDALCRAAPGRAAEVPGRRLSGREVPALSQVLRKVVLAAWAKRGPSSPRASSLTAELSQQVHPAPKPLARRSDGAVPTREVMASPASSARGALSHRLSKSWQSSDIFWNAISAGHGQVAEAGD